MIRDLLEQANDIQTKLNLLEQAKKEMIALTDPKNLTIIDGMPSTPGLHPGTNESAHIKNTRALRRLMEILK